MKKLFFVSVICLLSLTKAFPQDISIINFDELKERIDSNATETVIYNFWATWCVPCVKELPEFERIHSTGKENNRRVVLVSLDFAEHYEKKLLPFVRNKKLESEVVLLDAPNFNDWIPKIDKNWSGSIPATLIVNNEKNMRVFVEGSFNSGELEQLLESKGL